MEISAGIKGLLYLLIMGLIVVAVAPTLFVALSGVNQTGWTATEIAMWAIVVIVFVVGIILVILKVVEENK